MKTHSVRLRNNGFTLIEMLVVVTVLVLLASVIIPNVVTQKRGREIRGFYYSLRRLGIEAREMAITSRATYVLAAEDGAVLLQREDTEGERAEVRRENLPEGLTIGRLVQDGADSNTGDWALSFYPDGTADAGGIEISEGSSTTSLEIQSNGGTRLMPEPLPEIAEEKWDAGGYEQRAG